MIHLVDGSISTNQTKQKTLSFLLPNEDSHIHWIIISSNVSHDTF